MKQSEALFNRAEQVIPGGVNSPVRAFQSIGQKPRFITRSEGADLYDADGNRYIDYVCSWGPMILGHNHPVILDAVIKASTDGLSFGAATEREVLMAELICELVPSIEMVRMVNSGTEAVMSALRAARGFTGREKVVKFAGCYHGHTDSMLVHAGSGAMTGGVPNSLGVTTGCAKDTLVAKYNDLTSVKELFEQYKGEVAAIIVEPVAANMGLIPPQPGFLKGLRKICDEAGAVLIFDEVITGFRLGLDGAQGLNGVKPDLTTFGKIIGAGMPVGAYGGRRDIMKLIAPSGRVYQAGTLSGNPVAMAAGLAQLTILKEDPSIYKTLAEKGERFYGGIEAMIKEQSLPMTVNYVGSLGCLFFNQDRVMSEAQAAASDADAYAKYCCYLLDKGIYMPPSQFEAMFLSAAHSDADIDLTLTHIKSYMEVILRDD